TLNKAKQHWPLWIVLTVQLGLTLHWLLRYSPSHDETLYLLAGRQEWAQWLSGAPMPSRYPGFFSGEVFMWPPVDAIGYAVGGLAGARVIAMLLMLAVTALTYLTAMRMGGRRTAAFAAALAGLTGVADFVGATATFEPLALFFLMLAVYLVIRANGRWRWLAGAGGVLALANGAKYGTIAWDPLVAGIAMLYRWPSEGWKPAIRRGATVIVGLVAGDALLLLANPGSWHGMIRSTLARPATPPSHTYLFGPSGAVLTQAAELTGGMLVLALLGLILCRIRRESWASTATLALMTAGLLLTPIDQARLHQFVSLDRNSSFGVPLGAIAASFGICYSLDVLASRYNANPRFLQAVWTLPVIGMLIIGTMYPWQAGTHRGLLRVASFVAGHYRPGSYVGAVPGGQARQIQLSANVPLVSPRVHAFSRLFTSHEIVMVIVDHHSQLSGSASAAQLLALVRSTPGWSLLRQFGHGPRTVQVWSYRPPPHRKQTR
ncbi:MAG: glycosyltransferase family 39 protein, partial [Nocardiopsaceae bacterium]|nr:glycosyltransferase family 39 protein [Nocardiopsaceae bacterium]